LRQPAILLARVIAYVDAPDLLPGAVYAPDLANEVASRYGFQKFPQKVEDYELKKGVEFIGGKLESLFIQKFAIWENIVTVETRTSTDDCKGFLEDVLRWAVTKFGATYTLDKIQRFAYISDVSFYSDAPLLSLNNALTNLQTRTSRALSEIWQESVEYLPTSVKIGHDPVARHLPIAPFSIERKGTSRFSENKYFSEAPLPTKLHLEMLEAFEAEILTQRRVRPI
jgi:hypothetical protein